MRMLQKMMHMTQSDLLDCIIKKEYIYDLDRSPDLLWHQKKIILGVVDGALRKTEEAEVSDVAVIDLL